MMSYFMCCLLLLTTFGGVISKIILADQNETVQLFGNENHMLNEVSLYIHEDGKQKHIVTWTFKGEFISVGWADKNYSKIFMDPHRNIIIASINESYQKKYFINNSPSPEVEVIILEKRSVHEGDLVPLFKNVNKPDQEVSLWINGDINYTHIVTWRIENGNKSINAIWMVKNYRKIKMDEKRDIWIDNVDVNYNKKYFILNSSRLGVDLTIVGSNQLKSDNVMTVPYVIIAVLVAAIFILCFIYIKCLRNRPRKSEKMHDGIPPTGPLPGISSQDSTGKTKVKKRHSMGRTVDLLSSKFDMQGKGSEASAKLEHHGMILRPRSYPVMLSDNNYKNDSKLLSC